MGPIVRNILRTKLRSALTVFGIAAGIAVYVGLSSVTLKFREQMDRSFVAAKVDIVVHAARAASPMESRVAPEIALAVSKVAGVLSTAPTVLGSIKTRSLPYVLLLGVRGLEIVDGDGAGRGSAVIAGRIPKARTREAMLGRLLARRQRLWVGDTIHVDADTALPVVGIFDLGLDNLDGGILMSLDSANELLGHRDGFSFLLVRKQAEANLGTVVQGINALNPSIAAFPANRIRERFTEYVLIDTFAKIVSATAFFLSWLLIFNTLAMAVSERRREIAVLSTIGWSRARIVSMILAEALLLGLAGGVLGYALTFAALPMVATMPRMATGLFSTAPALVLLPKSMLLCAAASIAGALYPALSATCKSPIDGLRRE